MNNDQAEVLADERENRAVDRESTMESSVRTIKWLVVVLIILSVGNFARSFVNQDSTDKATSAAESLQQTSNEARDASVSTLEELREIVANIEAANDGEPDLQNQAVIDALAAVARIEAHLCGGVCPPPEP